MASPRKPSAPPVPDGEVSPAQGAGPLPEDGPPEATTVDEDMGRKTLGDLADLPALPALPAPPPSAPVAPSPTPSPPPPPAATSGAASGLPASASSASNGAVASRPPLSRPSTPKPAPGLARSTGANSSSLPPLIKPPTPSAAVANLGPTPIAEDLLSNLPTQVAPGSQGPLPVEITHAPPRLTVIGGNDRGREFLLEAHDYRIGRGTDNDIILTDIAVSRHHVVFRYDGARHHVRDLGSGNGTLLNGDPLDAEKLVQDGDQLELGNTMMRFEQPGLSAFDPPAFPADPAVPAPAFTAGGTQLAPSPYPPPAVPQPVSASSYPGVAMSPFSAYASYPGYPSLPTGQFPSGTPALAPFDLADMRRKKLLVLGAAAGAAVLLVVPYGTAQAALPTA